MSVSPRRRAFFRKPMFLAACQNRVFLHGPNAPKSCSRYSAVHILKIQGLFFSLKFWWWKWRSGVDSGTCPNPAGSRNGLLVVQKASKNGIKNRAILEAILDAKKHHFRIKFYWISEIFEGLRWASGILDFCTPSKRKPCFLGYCKAQESIILCRTSAFLRVLFLLILGPFLVHFGANLGAKVRPEDDEGQSQWSIKKSRKTIETRVRF